MQPDFNQVSQQTWKKKRLCLKELMCKEEGSITT